MLRGAVKWTVPPCQPTRTPSTLSFAVRLLSFVRFIVRFNKPIHSILISPRLYMLIDSSDYTLSVYKAYVLITY